MVGGLTGQAEAIRLAIARALVEKSPEYREKIKRTESFNKRLKNG